MTQSELHIERCKVVCLLILTMLALATALYFASGILVPIVLAWLLSSLLLPIVKFGNRYRIHSALTAAVIIVLMLVLLLVLTDFLAQPAAELLKELPANLQTLKEFVATGGGAFGDLQRVSQEVENLTEIEQVTKGAEPLAVKIKEPDVVSGLMTESLPKFTGYLIITLVLTFFLLSANQHFLRRMVRLNSTWRGKRQTVYIATKIQRDISRYLGMVTIINTCLGLLTAGYLFLLEVPNPLFWGALAGMLNFVPYIGAMATAALLTMVGLTEFPVMADALAVPGIFLILTTLEGQFITPTAVGHSLRLNPVSVFLGVIIWSWLWGVPGALMATPMLATIKILLANLPGIARLQMILKLGSPPTAPRNLSTISRDGRGPES